MKPVTRGRAVYGLTVLSLINLLNYLDRYILAGVMKKVQDEFHLSDAKGGLLATTFMVVYLCASPVGGYLGDRLPRRWLIGAAVMIWSLATVASGLATSFALLVLARACTGVGEAGYGTIAPPFIADLFEKRERGRMLAFFYATMPIGAALGFVVGGAVGDAFGWHHAFFVGGAPGILLALMAFALPNPRRGAMDLEAAAPAKVPFAAGLRSLATNAQFWIATAGLTLMTFSIGGLSNWMPKYLEAERGFTGTQAGLFLGATTVIGGFLGTIVGGIAGDRLDQRMAGGGVALAGVGLITAAPFMVAAVLTQDRALLFASLLAAQFFVFLNNGPLNAAVVNSVTPGFRTFAYGINTMLLHLLGDAASPTVIGAISDRKTLGFAIIVNAAPVVLAGAVLLLGLRAYRRPGAVAGDPTARPSP